MIISNKNIDLYAIVVLILFMLGLIIFYDFPEKHEDFFWYDQFLYWAVNTVKIGLVALAFFLLFQCFVKCGNNEWQFRILIPLPYTKARKEWLLQKEIDRLTKSLSIPKQEHETYAESHKRKGDMVDMLTVLKKQLRELNG